MLDVTCNQPCDRAQSEKRSIAAPSANQPSRPNRKASHPATSITKKVMAPLLTRTRHVNGGKPEKLWTVGAHITAAAMIATNIQNCFVLCGAGNGPSRVEAVIRLPR